MKGPKYLNLLRTLAMVTAMSDNTYDFRDDYKKKSTGNKQLRGISKMTDADKIKAKGLKEFNISGIKIVALNEKNAIRKFNKLK